jgi:hypothetical protein
MLYTTARVQIDFGFHFTHRRNSRHTRRKNPRSKSGFTSHEGHIAQIENHAWVDETTRYNRVCLKNLANMRIDEVGRSSCQRPHASTFIVNDDFAGNLGQIRKQNAGRTSDTAGAPTCDTTNAYSGST